MINMENIEPLKDLSEFFSWRDYQMKFDKFKDIDKIYVFLSDLITELRICNSAECSIFPKLLELNELRTKFDLFSDNLDLDKKITTLAQAKIIIKRRVILLKFHSLYYQYINLAKKAFIHIQALKTSVDSQQEIIQKNHERYKEVLDKFNQSKVGFPIDFTKSVQNNIDSYEDKLTIKADSDKLKKLKEKNRKEASEKEKEKQK